ncbi:MAG TPA: hypothetical protein DEQ87_13145 [Algoriphagus sp.]|jgi:hypothetical protein|uniref:hypothetical protein n=1 Tax=unclassified Algoriphagus TaxID=2641541 RepID=UPI000C56A04D|nr:MULTISPECIES: hypothetical protein [unclassified Algoriphagus]MAL15462.1 hypothetical protein [Algoriphagus sp.]MAN86851.1 hypothetical protein [Algoriphagus sp.]QYH40408.1 hypothetical protein GYM62_16985 [Algoriphagus sp. NBT04N3]HAD50103.1 hypothetical protein [Algoriphagus sp.]HAH36432.1 hypothetical protein [Algoriphagus sp.]|tara:strand:+ start:1271 stop:1840 length:570 start_codon:yes stop_codon:yes gene_type:complete
MKFRILVTLAFLISSLTSCENTPGIAPVGEMEVLPYYDLKGFVLQEIEKMDSSNQVSKITRINGEEKRSDVTFSKEDWKEELDAFLEADINKPSLATSFTTEIKGDILIHQAKPEAKTTIKEIQVRIVDDKPVWLRFRGAKESIFYTSYINGGIYMNAFTDKIDHYELESTQKIWFLSPNNMKIQGAVR